MKPGIVASQAGLSVIPFDPYTGADLILDFVNGVYRVGVTDYAAADVVDKPARIGASGLQILDNDADGVIQIIGDPVPVLTAANWTLRLDYEETKSGGRTRPLLVSKTDLSEWIEYNRENTSLIPVAFDTGATGGRECRDTGLDAVLGIGAHVVALTRTDAKLVMSVNGRPIVSDTGAFAPTLNHATFGGDLGDFSLNGCFIRSLIVYPTKADAELPTLSA